MMRLIALGILVLFCFGGNVWAEEEKDNGCVSVEPGDTLSGIARRLQTTVSNLAKENGIKNSNRIYPGETICRNGRVDSGLAVSKPVTPRVQGSGLAKTDGYIPYRNIGANPLVAEKDRDPKNLLFSERDALVLLGVTGDRFLDVVSLVTSGQGRSILLKRGDKFVLMSEGSGSGGVRISRKRVADWDGEQPATRFDLPDGRVLVRIGQCYNWAILEQPIPSTLEVVEKPAEKIALAAVESKPDETPPEETNICSLDDHELFFSRGGEIGNGAHTTYKYADGFACLYKTRVEGGVVKTGVEGVAGNWHGSASDGFAYGGKRYGVGPAVSFVDDDGWDARFGILFGRFLNSGHSLDGDYRQARNFDMVGPTFGINLYQRETEGEKLFPKTQIWGSLFRMHAARMNHSWQGNAISDTSGLKSSWLISFGIRQFLYQGPIKPWISGEFFGELPMTRNGTAMIGITDEDEIFWLGIGKTWNLKKGGSAKSWMVGVDLGNALRVIRGSARGNDWERAGSERYDPKSGKFTTIIGSGTDGARHYPAVARFDIATGQFVSPSGSVGSLGDVKRKESVHFSGADAGWNQK